MHTQTCKMHKLACKMHKIPLPLIIPLLIIIMKWKKRIHARACLRTTRQTKPPFGLILERHLRKKVGNYQLAQLIVLKEVPLRLGNSRHRPRRSNSLRRLDPARISKPDLIGSSPIFPSLHPISYEVTRIRKSSKSSMKASSNSARPRQCASSTSSSSETGIRFLCASIPLDIS